MADSENLSETKIIKNSKILVYVEEVLPDILVVSYAFETKLYQGVLLDSTKRTLPCGVIPPPLVQGASKVEGDSDKLYNLGQRFTYFQDKPVTPFHIRRPIRPPTRYRNTRMTVRLRPRQVLCSKCRSICNENSENVDVSRQTTAPTEPSRCSPRDLSPRPLFSENQRDNQPLKKPSPSQDPAKLSPTLIPKISRLQPSEISNALSGHANKMKIVGNYWVRSAVETNNKQNVYCDSKGFLGDEELEPPIAADGMPEDGPWSEEAGGRVLQKKRSIGAMEDLWDENVFEDGSKRARNARTLKISYGTQGEGTVLKIPAKLQSESDTEERGDHQKTKDASAKAAKRALKKAKKEARKKMMGNASPAYILGGTSPNYETLYHRRHKHKVKHKKKHREERRHDREPPAAETYSAIKERCLKQKLSISLRRLSANAYYLGGSNGSKSPASSSCCSNSSELSDDHGEAVPDFPSHHPLMLRITSQSVTSCLTSDGRRMAVGDVVWGKIHGFPWWPGKVLTITMARKDDSVTLTPQAHVAWYGSSTSSLMPCDQLSPFLDTFKTRYNKKKRGPYKEAIRQATCEAQRESQVSPLLPPVSSASPREVDVAS